MMTHECSGWHLLIYLEQKQVRWGLQMNIKCQKFCFLHKYGQNPVWLQLLIPPEVTALLPAFYSWAASYNMHNIFAQVQSTTWKNCFMVHVDTRELFPLGTLTTDI